MELPEALTHKAGPLPVWGWALVGGGALLLLARASTSGTASGATTLPTAGSTMGLTTADVQSQVQQAVAAQLASDRTTFGDMLAAAQTQDAKTLADQRDQFASQLSSEQATFTQQITALTASLQKSLTDQRAGDQSVIDQLRAALADAIAASRRAAPSPTPSTPTGGGSVGSGSAGGGNDGLGPPAPSTSSLPSLPTFTAPDWLKGLIPFGQIRAGYNQDHTLPLSLDNVQYTADGFHLPGAGFLQSWTFTPVNIRGITVRLPIAYTPQGAAHADDTLNLIVGRLNAIADGAGGWGVTAGASVLDAKTIYIIIRGVIEDQLRRGYSGDSLGIPYWQAFIAGS